MISVIICTYNRAKYIYHVLESIAEGDFPKQNYEIILVDNNCTDNTKDELARFRATWPDVDLKYFLETNQGLSYARNRGISESKGEIIVFLDDDAFARKDYLKNISTHFASHPEMDCFGGEIIPVFEDGKQPEWLCKWSLSWVSGINMGKSFVPFSKSFPIGANMGFRKAIFDECGVFNTNLGRSKGNLMGGEEKDIFMRIKKAGKKIFYIPGIEVQHMIPHSRTTKDYVVRLGQGVGQSEKVRCKSEGTYFKRLFSELIKWGATIILWFKYLITFHSACGNMLVRFRWNVSRMLLFYRRTES